MNPKTVQFQYDINRMDAVNLVATIHIDDYDTRFLEVLLCERGGAFDVSGSTAAARFVTLAGELLNDSVPCAVEGNAVTVPVDAAAVKSQACTLKIEINLTKDGKVLTLPFPLFVRVRGSILDDAHITPESEGTIADLLKAAQEALDAAAAALKDAGDYSKLDNKPQINGHTLSGDKTSSELGLQDKLTAGDNVTIDENGVISAEGGTDDYGELNNLPKLKSEYTGLEWDLKGVLNFGNEFFLQKKSHEGITNFSINQISGNKIKELPYSSLIRELKDYLFIEIPEAGITEKDVNRWGYFSATNHENGEGNIIVRISDPSKFRNLPDYVYTNYYSNCMVISLAQQKGMPGVCGAQFVLARNREGKIKIFARFKETSYMFVSQPWVEITGGSEIASAEVNQNGTITLYDKDGNPLFTTSGEKMVTSGNQQISMGYDNGGFYFLFDDGQEVVNNGTN